MCEKTSTAGGDGAGAGMEEDEMTRKVDPLRNVIGSSLEKGLGGLFYRIEALECGHTLCPPMGLGSGVKLAKRRRCWKCGEES